MVVKLTGQLRPLPHAEPTRMLIARRRASTVWYSSARSIMSRKFFRLLPVARLDARHRRRRHHQRRGGFQVRIKLMVLFAFMVPILLIASALRRRRSSSAIAALELSLVLGMAFCGAAAADTGSMN